MKEQFSRLREKLKPSIREIARLLLRYLDGLVWAIPSSLGVLLSGLSLYHLHIGFDVLYGLKVNTYLTHADFLNTGIRFAVGATLLLAIGRLTKKGDL